MAEAVLLVDIAADKASIRAALSTQEGITSWWTTDANVSGGVGGRMALGFPEAPMPFDLRVDEVGDDRVRWTSVGSFPPHWEGTEVVWTIDDHPSGSGSQVFFEHRGFATADPMLGHTAYTWALLMGHLASYAQTGVADPFFVN